MIGGFQPRAFQPAYQQANAPKEVPAGRKRRIREIYRITIDGQLFECRSLAEAITLLEKAKALAAKVAREAAAKAALEQEQTDKPVELPKLTVPDIKIDSRDLRAAVSETKRAIEVVYEKALVEAEIRMLMELNKRQDDNDEAILWLM